MKCFATTRVRQNNFSIHSGIYLHRVIIMYEMSLKHVSVYKGRKRFVLLFQYYCFLMFKNIYILEGDTFNYLGLCALMADTWILRGPCYRTVQENTAWRVLSHVVPSLLCRQWLSREIGKELWTGTCPRTARIKVLNILNTNSTIKVLKSLDIFPH